MSEKKVYVIAFLIQLIYTGMFMLTKAAFDKGINSFIFSFYRQAAATVILAPIAFYKERKTAPPLRLATFCLIFFHTLFGLALAIELCAVALKITSASLGAATSNTLPAITFVIAVLFRMEAVHLATVPGIAKLAGVVLCIAGAATLAFLRGPRTLLPCAHGLRIAHRIRHVDAATSAADTWIKGCFLMLASNILWGSWIVSQGKILDKYRSKLVLTTLQSFMSAVQLLVVALFVERDAAAWRVKWDVNLVAIVYCGTMATGVALYLQSWIIEKKGPVFLAMFTPLNLLLTALFSALLLCETIALATVVGGAILVAALYAVLWGKSQEKPTSIVSTANQP